MINKHFKQKMYLLKMQKPDFLIKISVFTINNWDPKQDQLD